MSETKVVVPPEMLKAAINEFFKAGSLNGRATLTDVERLTYAIEEVLRWLSENPIVPTKYEVNEMTYALTGAPRGAKIAVEYGAVEWQRRMFRAPEPEVPCANGKDTVTDYSTDGGKTWVAVNPPEEEVVQEAVKDLLWVLPADASIVEKENWKAHNEEILEAYRRGLRDK